MVKRIASNIAFVLPNHLDIDDLYSYGIIGLIDAINKFDPTVGVKFETYAYYRIKGSIIDGIRKEDWVPQSVRKKNKELEKAFSELERRLGRSATDQEVADQLGITIKELHQWLFASHSVIVLSLDESLDKDEDNYSTLLSVLTDINQTCPEKEIEKNEFKEILVESIKQLPEKEALVLSLYYYEELTFKEIAKVMSISESRISQLHSKAVLRMRGKLSRKKNNFY